MATGSVLIVDDEQAIRRICSLYLKAEGMDVETLAAADQIQEIARHHNPDVIVLDLNMPGTDGFRATQLLKSTQDTACIPVLILSARHDVEDKRSALLDCGADDYLTKPFDPKELITRIEVLRKRRHQNALLESTLKELEHRAAGMQEELTEELKARRYLQDTMLDLLDEKYIAPLKMINQMVNSLGERDAVQSRKFGDLLERTRQLENVLSKLSEFQKYRQGEIQPHFRYITIGRLISDLVKQYEEKSAETGVGFEFFSPNPDFQIITDPDRTRRVINLLLDRAFQITTRGKVEFIVSVSEQALSFTISDNSVDEAEETSETRKNNTSIKTDDTGIKSRSVLLKLPLARNIVEKINGKLIMSSQGVSGSSISIQLPLKSD